MVASGGIVAFLVFAIIAIDSAIVASEEKVKSARDIALFGEMRNEQAGRCKDAWFAVGDRTAATCPRADQRLTANDKWIRCTCAGEK